MDVVVQLPICRTIWKSSREQKHRKIAFSRKTFNTKRFLIPLPRFLCEPDSVQIHNIFAIHSPILVCMANASGSHRVYMSFMLRRGWQCQFLEEDLQTPLPRKLNFRSPDKIVALIERGGGFPRRLPFTLYLPNTASESPMRWRVSRIRKNDRL